MFTFLSNKWKYNVKACGWAILMKNKAKSRLAQGGDISNGNLSNK